MSSDDFKPANNEEQDQESPAQDPSDITADEQPEKASEFPSTTDYTIDEESGTIKYNSDLFAKSDREANQRFEVYKDFDPFPEIATSVLNSADFVDYVSATGMLFPFDSEKIKPASYGLKLQGKAVYWDDKGNRVVKVINKGDKFILPRNSIVFVSVPQTLRLPYYIIARFNLKINHIYKGILLGTGPIIDAGFVGKLSIPLHNLTNNDYEFVGGETLIWMEFQKISLPHPFASNENKRAKLTPPRRFGVYREYSNEKNFLKRDVEDYLKDAHHGPIESSLPNIVKTYEKIEGDVKKERDKVNDLISKFNWMAGLSFVAILSMVATIINILYTDLRDTKSKLDLSNKQHESRLVKDSMQLIELRHELDSVKAKLK